MILPIAAEPSPPWDDRARIGRYLVGDPIGRGAMGEVFRGEDTELARPVALKRLHVGTDAEARSKLAHEARAAAKLQHPNVVTVYEIVEDGDRAVLATEWIDGVNLREWLATTRTWRDAVRVVLGAGRGLAAAHAAGIVHRDFKPENVLVDREGRARVADFGLASSATGGSTGVSLRGSPMAFMSVTGTLSGTPAYMAPELVDGVRPHPGSDQFAFAVTLFEAVHGRYPFEGKTAEAIWTAMGEQRITRGERRVPGWLDRCLRRALSPDPADRFPDLASMLDEIERRSRRSIAVPLAIAGAFACAVAVAVSMLVLRSDAPACGDDLVDGVWNPMTRSGMSAQFGSVAPGRGATAAAFTAEGLDRWSASWRLGRRGACAVPAPERSARASCLDRQLGAVQAQLTVWSHADATVVDRAAAGVASLPRPEDCIAAAPAGAVPAALVEATAAVEALRRAGKFVQARAQIEALARAAELATDPQSKARALIAVGAIEFELRDHARAQAHLVTAAQAARQAHDDALLASALILQAEVRIAANEPAEALGLSAAVTALGVQDLTTAKIESVRGEALARLDRFDEAIAAYKRSAAIREAAAATDPTQRLEYANAIGALGSTLGSSGRREEAEVELKKCLAIEEPVLGPDHPEVARTLHDLAVQQRELGNVDAAVANYARARRIFVGALGGHALEVGSVDAALAHIAMAAGDFDRARALATAARAVYVRDNTRPDLVSSIETTLGNIEQNTDRCAAAIPHYEAALAEAKKARQTGAELGISYANLAACLADVSRDAEARNAIEAAIAAWDSAGEGGPMRAQAVAIFADLEAKAGRRAHAIELDRQVLAALKGVEGVEQLREYVEGQLAQWQRGR
jgi:tetratricopeptide (TPR) repeat protein